MNYLKLIVPNFVRISPICISEKAKISPKIFSTNIFPPNFFHQTSFQRNFCHRIFFHRSFFHRNFLLFINIEQKSIQIEHSWLPGIIYFSLRKIHCNTRRRSVRRFGANCCNDAPIDIKISPSKNFSLKTRMLLL